MTINAERRHLISVADLNAKEVRDLLHRALEYVDINRGITKRNAILEGRTQVNMFFEASTRTQASFEIAGKRLGMDVLNMSVSTSSMTKGETLLDTAATLNAMKPDLLVVRHQHSGAVQLLAQKVNCSVINAGDGAHEHPTQALLDALTIMKVKGAIGGLKVVICGDLLHSRVARSNLILLHELGAELHVAGPSTLLPPDIEEYGIAVHRRLDEALDGADVIMMLRVQRERMAGSFFPSVREYHHYFGLDHKKITHAKPDVMVMHPGPMNRGVEISSELADDPEYSVIHLQVEMGVAARMAAVEFLLSGALS
ncbi:MAG TPA: aspartate carbamoyltransferase catalytic subunit [Alphaproteobacteria bacterium]|nr:aspartate carbamoyltransferase catalytic subunit [Paracoccaceae bacterium]HCY47469.1 aspartate carbamoyltransferase catalytic subunit [Alphaproteobacteria bacterium]|tara:strand:+ start:280 stop:1215 length:936 start_codon:yes stop_codon:yes gene_type:complete